MSPKIAAACTTLWPCWFDQHEGAGAWLGAVATFMAACVALLLPFLLRWLDRVDTDRQFAWDSFLAAHHARGHSCSSWSFNASALQPGEIR